MCREGGATNVFKEAEQEVCKGTEGLSHACANFFFS